MVNLNGENSYISLLIYCSKATRYSLQQINSDDEHAQGVFWCGFFFFSPYQQYIACINEFMTYEPIILFPGLYKVKSNEGNAPQQHPIAYTSLNEEGQKKAGFNSRVLPEQEILRKAEFWGVRSGRCVALHQ